jgi:hypothetical protein
MQAIGENHNAMALGRALVLGCNNVPEDEDYLLLLDLESYLNQKDLDGVYIKAACR